jgi:hypothetical protein
MPRGRSARASDSLVLDLTYSDHDAWGCVIDYCNTVSFSLAYALTSQKNIRRLG